MWGKFKSFVRIAIFALLAVGGAFSAAQAEWRRAETDNFVVYAELSEEGLTAYARHLERFDALLRHYTGIAPAPADVKFTIYLVSDMGRLQRHMGGGGYLSGIYIADMRGPYAAAPVYAFDTVMHEYVHHFMLHNAPAVYPGWYREGFAEFFSTVTFDEEGHAQLGRFPRGRADDLEYSRRYPFRYMLADTGDTNPLAIYVQGWLMIHHTIFHAETRELLARYLDLINQGYTAAQAHQATFATLGDDLEDELKDYGRGRMPTSTTTRTFEAASEIAISELTEEEAEIRMLYPRRRDYLEREIVAAARRYPDNPQAQAELAQLYLAQNRLAEAIEAAEAGLASDPDHAEANTFKGTALLRRAHAGGDPSDPRWAQAREHFLRANRADPYYPLALLRYFQSFPEREGRPDNALAALEQAFRFVPQNPETRLQLAVEFLRAGRFAEAHLLAVPMTQSLHSTDAVSVAARRVVEGSADRDAEIAIEGLDLAEFIDEQ